MGPRRSEKASRSALERTRLFEDLLRQHEDQIYRLAYRLTGNRDDAQDLIQDSVIDALVSFDRFCIGSRFDRWMQRIITNNFIDRHRARSKVKVESLDQPTGSEGEDERTLEVADVTTDPPQILEQRALDEPVQRALDELQAEYRAVVVLSDIEGYSYQEIATMLRVPIGTVRSRLNRGRNILREKLADYARQRYRR
ncbi:MAG: sigma-70 family RNA polymerase sigma factor [Armatimonadetes bacterium]|nr:sigma-70 family RNA polymerase sigma factor [Armatimonadota bacterium]